MNPSRHQVSEYRPARVTLAVLTYMPNFDGYFSHRFDILRLSLDSLLANTTIPYDLMVFDNGSCVEVVDYLRGLNDMGKIRYLLLSSENIGKIGALQIMFQAAPGEIIAYSDDDILFEPGWLEAHLQIIDTYPDVGMVSGLYLRSQMREGLEAVEGFAGRPDVEATRGRLIPEEWERDYVANSGREWATHAQETAHLQDLELRYQGVACLASAHHAQFVCPRQVILKALPDQWSGRLMGKVREIDLCVNQMGYLRLSTRQRVTQLMGNVVDEAIAAKARAMGIGAAAALNLPKKAGLAQRLARIPIIRRAAQGLYNRLYWLINAE